MNATNAIVEARSLTSALRSKRGSLVGIACKKGLFAVTETVKTGRKSVTEYLSEFQSYGECVAVMRELAE